MKHTIFGFALLTIAVLALQCRENSVDAITTANLQGQVYSIGSAGPYEGEPTPLRQTSTVLVLDSNKEQVLEIKTNAKGEFEALLEPGTYYLRVMESPTPRETGPFNVVSDQVASVQAYYDEGKV